MQYDGLKTKKYSSKRGFGLTQQFSFSRNFKSKLSHRKVPISVKSEKSTRRIKRLRIFLLSILIPALLAGVLGFWKSQFRWYELLAIAGGLGFLTILLMPWAYRFEVKLGFLFPVILLPFSFTVLGAFSIGAVYFKEFSRISEMLSFAGAIVVFGFGLYGLFLAQNLLNVAKSRSVPLAQVAQTASYFYSLVVFFVAGYWLFVARLAIWISAPIWLSFGAVLFSAHFAHFMSKLKEIIWIGIICSYLAVIVGVAVSLWPLPPFMPSLLGAVAGYIGVGLVMHELKKVLNWRVLAEYMLIFAGLIILAVILARWGIYEGIFWWDG